MRRITADIDTKDLFKVSMYITKALLKIKEIKSLTLEESSTKGYHLIIWTKRDYTLKHIYNIRRFIGDDYYRLTQDKSRKFGRQTLFNKKHKIK